MDTIPITQDGYNKLLEEFARLKKVELPAIIKKSTVANVSRRQPRPPLSCLLEAFDIWFVSEISYSYLVCLPILLIFTWIHNRLHA